MRKEGLLKRAGRKIAPYALAGSLFFSSCKDVPVGPPTNEKYDPVAVLSINPEEGYAPLESTILCSDKNPGKADRYSLNIDNENISIQSGEPIEINHTFNNSENYIAECVSYADRKSNKKSGIISVYEENKPPKPFVSQTADTVNRVNLRYNATLKNLDEASLEVLRDGEQVFTDTITESDYSKTFSYASNKEITKGNYDFKLSWKTDAGKDTSVTTGAEIPNWKPEFDSSGLNLEMDEEGQITKNLESRISDTNPEDNPVIASASSPDRQTQVTFSDSTLTIKGNIDKFGEYDILLNISDGSGGAIAPTIKGYLHPWARISGTVKNVEDENLAGKQSMIKVYDENWNELATKESETNGGFNIKVKERASSLDALVIQAAHGNANGITGYVRTETIPGELTNPESQKYNPNIVVMGVPHDENIEAFVNFFKEFGFPNKFDFDGRYLSNFNGLERIRILNSDPCDASATFDINKKNQIEKLILSPDHVSKFTGNYQINDNQIARGGDEGGDYTVDCNTSEKRKNIKPSKGIVVVSPRNEFDVGGRAGEAVINKLGSFVRGGTIYLVPAAGDQTITHEFWHMLINGPHPDDPYGKTIGSSPLGESTAGPWDEKAGKILYHELGNNDGKWSHFVINSSNLQTIPQWELPVENILGLRFGPENKRIRKNGKYWHGK